MDNYFLQPIIYYLNYLKRFNRFKYIKLNKYYYFKINQLLIHWFLKKKSMSNIFFYDLVLGHYFWKKIKITNFKTLLKFTSDTKQYKFNHFLIQKFTKFSIILNYIKYFKELSIQKISLKNFNQKPYQLIYRRITYKQNLWWRNFIYIKYFKYGLFHVTKIQLTNFFLIKLFNFKKWFINYNFDNNILDILCFGFILIHTNFKFNKTQVLNEKLSIIYHKLLGFNNKIYLKKHW